MLLRLELTESCPLEAENSHIYLPDDERNDEDTEKRPPDEVRDEGVGSPPLDSVAEEWQGTDVADEDGRKEGEDYHDGRRPTVTIRPSFCRDPPPMHVNLRMV